MPNIDFIESKSTSFEAIEWRPPIFIRWIIAKFFSRVIFFNQGGGRPIQKISIDNFKKWVNRNSPSFRLKIWKTDLKKNRKSTFFSSWEKYAEEDPGEPFRRRRNFVGQKRKYNIKKRRHITCIKDKRKSWKFLRRVAVGGRNLDFISLNLYISKCPSYDNYPNHLRSFHRLSASAYRIGGLVHFIAVQYFYIIFCHVEIKHEFYIYIKQM